MRETAEMVCKEELPKAENIEILINSATDWLKKHQNEEGYWVGMLESNSCMEAEWILLQHFLGIENDKKYQGVVNSILREQRNDGSWEVFHNAPSGDINTTVECYTALRVSGLSPDSEPMVKAREWILQRDLRNLRVFTKYWLALIGEWPWSGVPQLAPEMIFLPSWAPLNIYKFSSWARGTIIPLTILCIHQPTKPLPAEKRLDELFPHGREHFDFSLPKTKNKIMSWEKFFFMIDRSLSIYLKSPVKPFRKMARKLCLQWIVQHQEADGAWSGIQPPWIYSLMALHVEGYSLEHPVVANGLSAFDKHWSYEKEGSIYLQASESPVWDTLLSLMALLESGSNFDDVVVEKAINWVLQKQITVPGDWQVRSPKVKSGGWAFERANNYYPDIDDTSIALIVLSKIAHQIKDNETHQDLYQKICKAIEAGKEWTIGLQSSNGGWGAFDKDNNSKIVTKIPFCDFGEALDPPSVDVTSHVLEAFGELGYDKTNPIIKKALKYIQQEQEEDGSWFGRWGVNYIYGTAAVLPALKAVGEDMNSLYVHRAAQWIVKHQNTDGGWGETCESYMDETLKGKGESTASQTAWALMALLAIDTNIYNDPIQKGIEWLSQNHIDGTWNEEAYTGTGFPGYGVGERVYLKKVKDNLAQGKELSRAFMINYNYYRHYFPLMALGRAQKHFSKPE